MSIKKNGNVFGNTQYAWIPSSTKITKIGFRLLPQSTIGSPGITPQSNSSITARYLPSGRTLANYFSVAGDPCYYQVVLQEAFNSDDTLLITNVGTGGYLDWTINGTY